MTEWWHDLADSELRARLVNRGVDVETAYAYVAERENAHTAEAITRILDGTLDAL